MNSLSSHVRTWRERAGLRPVELARAVGITRQALHSIETGAYVPNTLIAFQLARTLNCGVEDLFTLAEAQVHARLMSGAAQSGRVQLAELGGAGWRSRWRAWPSRPTGWRNPPRGARRRCSCSAPWTWRGAAPCWRVVILRWRC